jgi:hypothetical protein
VARPAGLEPATSWFVASTRSKLNCSRPCRIRVGCDPSWRPVAPCTRAFWNFLQVVASYDVWESGRPCAIPRSLLQVRQARPRHPQSNRPSLAGCSLNQTPPFERHDHPMHRRRRHLEELLEVRLRRGHAVDLAEVVDEREILPLFRREPGLGRGATSVGRLAGAAFVNRRSRSVSRSYRPSRTRRSESCSQWFASAATQPAISSMSSKLRSTTSCPPTAVTSRNRDLISGSRNARVSTMSRSPADRRNGIRVPGAMYLRAVM